ncbi:MAG: hypothetical protein ACYC91_11390 [Solirubrobacteraceae bacterium]
MSDSIWTSDDPQPEDLDAFLETLDPALIERHPGGQRVRVRIVVDLDADDAERLSRIASSRGEDPREVLSSLLRAADRPAA